MNPTFKGIGVAALLVFGLSPSFARGGESAAFRGRVIMESGGKPAANVEVRLVTWTRSDTKYDVKKATTNDQGEFVFESVAPGKHRLVAFFEDYSSRKSLYKGEAVDRCVKAHDDSRTNCGRARDGHCRGRVAVDRHRWSAGGARRLSV